MSSPRRRHPARSTGRLETQGFIPGSTSYPAQPRVLTRRVATPNMMCFRLGEDIRAVRSVELLKCHRLNAQPRAHARRVRDVLWGWAGVFQAPEQLIN